MTYRWIVLATGPYDSCAYGPFDDFDQGHDWAAEKWPEESAITFQVLPIYSKDEYVCYPKEELT